MANHGVMVGWNHAHAAYQQEAIGKFGEYIGWLGQLQAENRIESFEPVFVSPHGGNLNGFVLIRGDAMKLAELKQTAQWKDWIAWGFLKLEGFGAVDVDLGDSITDMVGRLASHA